MAQITRPVVVVTRQLPEPIEARMAELFDVRAAEPAKLADALADADVLVPTIVDRIDAHVLAAAGDRLRLIANYGNGVDPIDL